MNYILLSGSGRRSVSIALSALFGTHEYNFFIITTIISFVQEQGRSKKYQRKSMFVSTKTKEEYSFICHCDKISYIL